jgi:hypothetical protein
MNSSHDITNILTYTLYLISQNANVSKYMISDFTHHINSTQQSPLIVAFLRLGLALHVSCLMQLLFTRVVPLPLLVNKPLHKSSVQAKAARISSPF